MKGYATRSMYWKNRWNSNPIEEPISAANAISIPMITAEATLMVICSVTRVLDQLYPSGSDGFCIDRLGVDIGRTLSRRTAAFRRQV
jgi:hypothetical protein